MRPMPPPMLEPALLSLEDSSKNSCAKIGTEMRKRNHATSHKTAQFSVHSLTLLGRLPSGSPNWMLLWCWLYVRTIFRPHSIHIGPPA